MPLQARAGRLGQGRIPVNALQAKGLALGTSVLLLGALPGVAQIAVTVEVANAAGPSGGGPAHEFAALVFLREATAISVRSFDPFLVLAAGERRELGPFELPEAPNALIPLGRTGEGSLAVTVAPLVPGAVHGDGALRVAVRFGPETREGQVALRGYLFALRQLWCTRSEGPLYLLQTGEFGMSLEGFYILVGSPRWPWVEDPLLGPLVGKSVEVRGTPVPAGEKVRIAGDRRVTYPLPAPLVEGVRVLAEYEPCAR